MQLERERESGSVREDCEWESEGREGGGRERERVSWKEVRGMGMD